jgi:ankyrin repeat protein
LARTAKHDIPQSPVTDSIKFTIGLSTQMKTPSQINLRGLVFRRCRHHLVFMVVLLVMFRCGPIAGAAGILEAAKAGDAAGVRSILETNAAAASVTNRWGETALHLGAGAASPAVVEALLSARAPVNAQSQGNTALHYAISYQRMLRFAEDVGETNIQQLLGMALKSIENPEMRSVGDNATPVDKMILRRALTTHDDPERTRAELKIVELLLAADADLELASLGGLTPLHCAAMRSEPEFLQLLLAKGADVSIQTRTGETPLHYAALFGSPATVKLLLDKGAKVGKANRFGNTPLFFAVATSGKPEIARLLLERGAFADDMNNDGGTPLNTAVRLQDREMVTLLLDQGHAAINGRAGKLSETALHAAAGRGDAAMVRLLLEHKADINATDKSGFTPLLNAAEKGQMAIVEILVEQGADPAARTQQDGCAFALAAGATNRLLLEWLAEKLPALDFKDKVFALQSAAMHGRLANVRWLLEKGVPAGVTNFIGTPLLSASGGRGMIARMSQQKQPGLQSLGDEAAPEKDYAQIVSLLLANGAEVNAVGSEGRTPLLLATTFGSFPIAETLLQHKADIQARSASGKTPLHQAATFGDDRLVELLLAHGAALEAKDNDGFTPLRDAASVGNSVTIKSLLAHGGDVSVRDRYSATPLHWAAMTTNLATVTLLLDAGAQINALDMGSRTPLHQAADTGREDVVQLLLVRKADATARDANSDTPADLARKKGFSHIVLILSGQSAQPSKPSRE